MDQILPDAVPRGRGVFAPSQASLPPSITSDIVSSTHTDSDTLVTNKQPTNSETQVGSSYAATSKGADIDDAGSDLMQIDDVPGDQNNNEGPIGAHGSQPPHDLIDNQASSQARSRASSPSIAPTTSSRANKRKRSALDIPSSSSLSNLQDTSSTSASVQPPPSASTSDISAAKPHGVNRK